MAFLFGDGDGKAVLGSSLILAWLTLVTASWFSDSRNLTLEIVVRIL